MNQRSIIRYVLPAMLAVIIASLATTQGFAQVAIDDQFGHEPSWQIPTSADVHAQIVNWLDAVQPTAVVRAQAESLWSANIPADRLLQQTVATISLVDDQARQLALLCQHSHGTVKTPEFAWLIDDKTPALVRNNMRLWFGKWLAEERLYDEAITQLNELAPADVVDPAALLFYQCVCHHWMLHKTDGLTSINKLLEQTQSDPAPLSATRRSDAGRSQRAGRRFARSYFAPHERRHPAARLRPCRQKGPQRGRRHRRLAR